ncbi:MAG: four helix bundle suffix domain-containing protein [Chloroflexales bacterium]
MPEPLLVKRGGYRRMDTFMLATIVYYATVAFCRQHIRSNRQVEQMVQAARSGRQNLAEGSERAATSSQTEMTLPDVARASLAELQLDYEDFINMCGQTPWLDDDPDSLAIKAIRLEQTPPGKDIIHNFSLAVAANRKKFDKWLASDDPVTVANGMVRLCDRADFLIRRQLAAQGEHFLEEGGFKERLTRCRAMARAEPAAPACPKCGEPMRLRNARKGPRAGGKFWGCTNYPACDGLREVETAPNISRDP